MKRKNIDTSHIPMSKRDHPKRPERLQSLIDAHGEVSLLRQLANAIRKNVRLNVNFATGQITVTVAGEVVADRTIKR